MNKVFLVILSCVAISFSLFELNAGEKKKDKKIEKNSAVNEIDIKLDKYSTSVSDFCNLMKKQNNGENVYRELDKATRDFAELNQELSGLIEDKKFNKKQYTLFIKITEKYESCQ